MKSKNQVEHNTPEGELAEPEQISSVVGTFAKLTEKPDGYTSKDYPVTIGKKYKILDISGCCYLIKVKVGSTAFINKNRFSLA